jgi:hypothetical protein
MTILWGSKTHFEWSEVACAVLYNVYRRTGPRLPDSNHDGVADDYGGCFLGGLGAAQADDTSLPVPGEVHFYLVTGENGAGEGGLGFTHSSQMRPNVSPCP